ncbi:hypothetical protein H1C71_036415 [Ictidomys tridecemlineatus]|nr:hypothetical protein H1C71_036415 [Ictidomys tridecemlineatus]
MWLQHPSCTSKLLGETVIFSVLSELAYIHMHCGGRQGTVSVEYRTIWKRETSSNRIADNNICICVALGKADLSTSEEEGSLAWLLCVGLTSGSETYLQSHSRGPLRVFL